MLRIVPVNLSGNLTKSADAGNASASILRIEPVSTSGALTVKLGANSARVDFRMYSSREEVRE